MAKWPQDTQAARNAFYGDPGKGEISSQLVPVIPPFVMRYEGTPIKSIMFHRKAAPALKAALEEIWDVCGHDQKKIDAAGVSKYAGAYNHRMVRGSTTKWSNHAYGTAIDLNAEENALGQKNGTMPQFVVDAFVRQGWMWGGFYKTRPDFMHFEAVDNSGRQPKSALPLMKPIKLASDEADYSYMKDKPVPAKAAVVTPADHAKVGSVVIATTAAAGAAAASQSSISALAIVGCIGGLTAVAIGSFIIGYRIVKGHWPWTGNQSQALSLPSLPQSAPSLAALSAARQELASVASQAAPLPKPLESKPRRKRSAKPSQKTPTQPRKSSNLKTTVARKSPRKHKSK